MMAWVLQLSGSSVMVFTFLSDSEGDLLAYEQAYTGN